MELKLLQVASADIAQLSGGMNIRNYYIARHLAQVMSVTHLGLSDRCQPLSTLRHDGIQLKLFPKPTTYTIGKLARGALGKTPVNLLNYFTFELAAALVQELEATHYHTVLLEGVEMSPYLPIVEAYGHGAFVALDWHNIESELVTRHSSHARTPLHRLYMQRAASQLKRIEAEMLESCHFHIVTSQRESDQLLSIRPQASVAVVENGVDLSLFDHWTGVQAINSIALRNRLLFVGAMDYSANVSAVYEFATGTWPKIHAAFPQLVFTIVGRNPSASIRELAFRPGIAVTGTVDDVRPYYQEAFAAVVPLRVGGGTRLKILEAMAAGVPVISTSLGAEGLRVRPDIHLILAEGPDEFFQKLVALRRNPRWWQQLSTAGRELVKSTYDWSSIGARLVEVYLERLTRWIKLTGNAPESARAI